MDPLPLPPLQAPRPMIEYANTLPQGSGLHCSTDAGHVRVWRDPPGQELLMRELAGLILVLGLFLFLLVVMPYLVFGIGRGTLATLRQKTPYLMLSYLPLLFWSGYLVLSAWQNAGIVTEIDVGEGWFVWKKQTLFRVRTYRWRADSIAAIKVTSLGAINYLRVYRRLGFKLCAFSRFRRDELAWAADALRAAVELFPA